MSTKTIVTSRNTLTNEQIFIKCSTVNEALYIAGKLHKIELSEHTYKSIRLRGSKPSKLYKDMTSYFLNNGA